MLIVHLLPHVFSSPSFPAFDLRSSSRAAVSSTAYDDYEDLKMQVEDLDVQLPPEERAALTAIGGTTAATYGEITAHGFAQLSKRLRLGPGDTFVDCGSGVGRVVEQAARNCGADRSYGVEFAGSRHAAAVARLGQHAAYGGAAAGPIRLLQGDCADESLWADGGELSACTCAYSCNILFDDALNARLKRCFEQCAPMRRVAVFRPWVDGLDGFSDPTTVQCETSWSADTPGRSVLGVELMASGTSTVYVYERRASFLPAWWSDQLDGALIGLGIVLVGTVLGLF